MTKVAAVEGSQLPWTSVEPRRWQWTSEDGLTLLRVSRVGMDHEKNHYAFKNGKLLGHRRELEDAKILAEAGTDEVTPALAAARGHSWVDPADPLALPETLQMTRQQRAAARDAAPRPRGSFVPEQLRTPLVPSVTKSGATPPKVDKSTPVYADPEFQKVLDAKKNRTGVYAKITDDKRIVVGEKNPKKPGSEGSKHYEQMRGGITVAQYAAKFRSEKDKRTARQWLSNMVREGLATLEGK